MNHSQTDQNVSVYSNCFRNKYITLSWPMKLNVNSAGKIGDVHSVKRFLSSKGWHTKINHVNHRVYLWVVSWKNLVRRDGTWAWVNGAPRFTNVMSSHFYEGSYQLTIYWKTVRNKFTEYLSCHIKKVWNFYCKQIEIIN